MFSNFMFLNYIDNLVYSDEMSKPGFVEILESEDNL